ncbi:hypothetical protein KBK24_0121545 [Burkholderia sp. K24]|nr:hypothetical protein KBK24_0121545 [Burkholderia sp. K24]
MIAVKNVSHPNMFPGAAVASAPDAQIATDADVAGIAATPAPTSAWANPLSKLRPAATPAATPASPETKQATRADQAIAYLRTHGPSTPGDLCKAMGITSKGGVTPFINAALSDGRIVRNNGKYSLPGEAAAQPSAEPKATPAAVSHFEAASTIVAGRKKAKAIAAHPEPAATAAPANLPVPASEAAAAIAAMRQPAESEPPPLPAHAPDPAVIPAAPSGRKPDFVVFVGDVQLLSWPDGDITIQTENCTVDLDARHFRALLTLVELRNDFSVVSRRL